VARAFWNVYRYWTVVLFVAVLVQIGAAGYAVFNVATRIDDEQAVSQKTFDSGYDVHNGFGYVIFFGAVLLLLFALAGGVGRRRLHLVGAILLDVVLQIALAWLGENNAWVGIFHPVNAVVLLGLTGLLAYVTWRDPAAPGARVTPAGSG
jgi:hypothetical protein